MDDDSSVWRRLVDSGHVAEIDRAIEYLLLSINRLTVTHNGDPMVEASACNYAITKIEDFMHAELRGEIDLGRFEQEE